VNQLLNPGPEQIFSPLDLFYVVAVALVCLFIVARSYQATHRGVTYAQSYIHSLFLMGLCSGVVMMIIGSNVARAFSLVGALSIIRFRTAVKDVRDTAYLFFAIIVGMGAGTGFYVLTLSFTVVAAIVMAALHYFRFAERKVTEEVLKITLLRDEGTAKEVAAYLGKTFDEHRLINSVRHFDDDSETQVFVVRAKRGFDPGEVADGLAKIANVKQSSLYLNDQQVAL
jgi:uncharacterized membrane protein YhiD involved in acid resistance